MDHSTSKEILQKKGCKVIKVWKSISEAHKNGFNQGAVWLCCNNKGRKYKNFNWEYKEMTD